MEGVSGPRGKLNTEQSQRPLDSRARDVKGSFHREEVKFLRNQEIPKHNWARNKYNPGYRGM